MSFWSGIKVFGKDLVHVFAWAGSPKGQQVIGTGEGILEAVLPVSIPIVSLFNSWFQKAYTVEALAVAAGQASGTGVDKAALAIQTVTPQVLQYAVQEGLSARTAAQVQAANDAVIAFIKAMTDEPKP